MIYLNLINHKGSSYMQTYNTSRFMHQFENKIIKNTAQIDQHECLSSQREKQRGFM